jgi:hypothetical protein
VVAAAAIVGGIAVLAACAFASADVSLLLQPARGGFDRGRMTALVALLAGNAPMLSLIPIGGGMILGGVLGLGRALAAAEPED